jgi:hypothetical protein
VTSERFEGVDRIQALAGAAIAAVLIVVGIGFLHAVHLPLWPMWIAAALGAAHVAGHRYRLTVSPEGIELVSLRFFVVPVERERWLLDARIEVYESLDADGPEGLCVEEAEGAARRVRPTRCFGPTREEAIRTLLGAARTAVEAFRAAAPACPPALRHAQLGSQSAQLAVAEAARYASGRLREIVSVGPIQLGGLELPAGSQLQLNREGFIDPRRDDQLIAVRVAKPVVVFGRTTHADAQIWFRGEESPVAISEAFDPETDFDGRPVDGRAMIGFSPQGRLTSFRLARAIRVSGVALPAGSRLHYWDGPSSGMLPARWTCFLSAPVELPEVTLAENDYCDLSPDLSRLIAISPRRDVSLPDGYVLGGIMSLPVTPEGRIDRAACRKRGLLRARAR